MSGSSGWHDSLASRQRSLLVVAYATPWVVLSDGR